MSVNTKLWLLIVLLASLLCGAQEHDRQGSQTPVAKGASAISLSLKGVKSAYSLGEDLVLDAILRNQRSLDPVFIYSHLDWGRGAGMNLAIEDQNGNQVETLAMDSGLLPPPQPNDLTILVKLRFGQFFGISLNQPIRRLIPKPGRYRMRLEYSSVLFRDLADERLRNLNVIWKGAPPIFSPWVNLEVTQ